MKMKFPILVFSVLSIPSLLFGQISFETTEVEIEAEFGAKQVSHDFRFTNAGDYPIEIIAISSSCGCTTAALEKRLYDPGESGQITGIFTVGERVGERHNSITIRTDDPENPGLMLRMTINIPQALTLSHRLLTWQRGTAPVAQTVEVVFHPDSPYKLDEIEIDGENFRVEVIVDEEKEKRYLLEITPIDLAATDRAIIYLRTIPEPENLRAFSVYTYVR